MVNFNNKKGDISAYGLLCGYMQLAKNGTSLYMEHDHYHVLTPTGIHMSFWSNKLTQARACFRILAGGLESERVKKADEIWNQL